MCKSSHCRIKRDPDMHGEIDHELPHTKKCTSTNTTTKTDDRHGSNKETRMRVYWRIRATDEQKKIQRTLPHCIIHPMGRAVGGAASKCHLIWNKNAAIKAWHDNVRSVPSFDLGPCVLSISEASDLVGLIARDTSKHKKNYNRPRQSSANVVLCTDELTIGSSICIR